MKLAISVAPCSVFSIKENFRCEKSRKKSTSGKPSLKILQNSQEKTFASIFFSTSCRAEPGTELKNRLRHSYLPVNFMDTFYIEQIRATTFEYSSWTVNNNFPEFMTFPIVFFFFFIEKSLILPVVIYCKKTASFNKKLSEIIFYYKICLTELFNKEPKCHGTFVRCTLTTGVHKKSNMLKQTCQFV